MKIVKIKKEYCENIEESKLNFEIVEDNGNRLLIRAINTGLSIPPITLVKKEWLIF